jgi:Secretory lipase
MKFVVPALVALALASPAAADVPLPENDPFFAVPAQRKLTDVPNGRILDSRPVDVGALGVPLPVAAWQVKYKTIDVHGNPSAYVATVMVPDAPWTGGGPRPLVSYQTAEDGVGSKCAPSYALRAGLAATSNSSPETIAMELALARGWAVVAPDYEGPRSEFLGAKGEARGVIDGVRATLRFSPAGFDRDGTPVGLIGYSGGALASTLAAQLQPRYAPHLRFAGVALGGVPADVGASLRAFSGSPFGGTLAMGLAAADRSYPQAHIEQYLNAAGRAALVASQRDCINDAVARYPGARIEQFAKDPNVFASRPVVALLHRMSPLWFRGTPRAPVYEYHAVLDELAPIGPARQLIARFCAAGVRVQHYEEPIGEHITLVATGYPAALDYLQDRFDGKPAPSTC